MSCIFCGAQGPTTPVKFPKTYTAYQFLQAGSGACAQCKEKLKDPKYRRNCWFIRDGKFSVLDEPLETLLDLPEPPFLIYLTKQKRKHGWVLAVQNPVLNREKFFVAFEEKKILVEPKKLGALVSFAGELRGRGVPKKVLLAGYPWASVIRKYGLSHGECLRLKTLHNNGMWRVCVEFGR